MSIGFKIAIVVIVVSAAALLYGFRPTPQIDSKTFPIAKKQVEKRIDMAGAKIDETKKRVKKSAVKVEELTLTAVETEAVYAEIKNSPTPVADAEKLAAADAALQACDNRADALADHIDFLNVEIIAHEEKEQAQSDEIELFSARIDELNAENTSLHNQMFWARWGAFGVIAGGLAFWALVAL